MATKTVWAFHIHFCRKRTRQKNVFPEEKIFFLLPQILLHPSSLTYMGSIFSSGFSNWKKKFWRSPMSIDRKSMCCSGDMLAGGLCFALVTCSVGLLSPKVDSSLYLKLKAHPLHHIQKSIHDCINFPYDFTYTRSIKTRTLVLFVRRFDPETRVVKKHQNKNFFSVCIKNLVFLCGSRVCENFRTVAINRD